MRTSVLVLVVLSTLLATHGAFAHSPLTKLRKEFDFRGNATMEVTPNAIGDGADVITCKWSGIPKPNTNDTVSIRIVNNDPSATTRSYPVGYFNVQSVKGWQTGSGQVSVRLFHPRQLSFVFEYNSFGEVLASAAVAAAQPDYASQVHIALTHDPHEMRITYVSYSKPGENSASFVQYSRNYFDDKTPIHVVTDAADPLWKASQGKTLTSDGKVVVLQVPSRLDTSYTIADMCNEPANVSANFFHPGDFHDLVLHDLSLSSAYFYRVGAALSGPGRMSKTYRFVTSPGVGADIETDFFAFGDLGWGAPFVSQAEQQPPSVETMNNIRAILDERIASQTERPSMVLHIGDISYGRGISLIWEMFMQQIEPIASALPWMISLGNHEYDYPAMPWKPDFSDYNNDSGGECGVPSYRRFHMPPDYTPAPHTDEERAASRIKSERRFGELEKAREALNAVKGLAGPESKHHSGMKHDGTVLPHADEKNLLKSDSIAAAAAAAATAAAASMPNAKDPRNIAYAFEFGAVHFTLFSAEHPFLEGSDQYNFIVDDLKKVDRTRTPWVVLACHRPLYCSTTGCSIGPDMMGKGMDNVLRRVMEPLMLQHRVDLGLWGHIHTYERTCAMKDSFVCADKDDTTKGAPVHAIIGMAGNVYNNNWQPYLPANPHIQSTSLRHHQQPDWSIFRTMNFGFTHISANRTNLHLRFLGNHRSLVHDEFTLTRP